MKDKEKKLIIIEKIEAYFKEIEEMKIRSIKDLNLIKLRAVSMDIFSIINLTIDLGNEIVFSLNIGFPSEYKEIFTLLRRKEIINEKLENDLKELIILRNKISHRYGDLEEKEIFNSIIKINSVKDFIKRVKEIIKK